LPDHYTYNESEILLRISEGDEQAFAALFDHYAPRVKHIAKLFTVSDAIAEDIVQDVFMKVWLKRRDLPEIQDLKNWLFIVARNFAINALKKIAHRETSYSSLPDLLPYDTPVPDAGLDARDLEKNIRIAMLGLTDQQQKVFELARLQGMSREEISKTLDLSPNTVKMHLVRSTRFVRAWLMAKGGRLLSFLL
jgi:RNA polymerase sigma-70 factor (family 1)